MFDIDFTEDRKKRCQWHANHYYRSAYPLFQEIILKEYCFSPDNLTIPVENPECEVCTKSLTNGNKTIEFAVNHSCITGDFRDILDEKIKELFKEARR